MAKGEIYAGLDIGSTKVCTAVAEAFPDGRIDIIGVGIAQCSGLKKGVVVDMDSAANAIKESVDIAQKLSGTEIHSAVVSVTGEHIASQNSIGRVAVTREDQEIRREHVERVLDASRVIPVPPEREIIHAIPRGFIVDGQAGIKDPVGMSGRRIEVETHIVTGATSFLQNVTKCVQRAGLDSEEMVLTSIASGLATTSQEERNLGVGVVDIGGGTTDIAIFTEGEVSYTAVLPIGGSHITHDIAVGLQTSQEEAERAKRDYGCASTSMAGSDEQIRIAALGSSEPKELPRRILAEMIEPRVEEILEMVRREIVRSEKQALLPMGIVLTGGGALLPGMVESATRILDAPCRIESPRGIGGMVESVNSPIHSTAVGLIKFIAAERSIDKNEIGGPSLLGRLLHRMRGLFG